MNGHLFPWQLVASAAIAGVASVVVFGVVLWALVWALRHPYPARDSRLLAWLERLEYPHQ